MSANDGLYHEDAMVAHLHNKHYRDLSNNLRNLVRALYRDVQEDDLILCQKTEGYIKPDFYLECQGQRKYVSMKSGSATCLHEEYVDAFVAFLDSLGISKETQETILLYHFGDGTTDGSAPERIEYTTLRVMLNERIKRANLELNRDKATVKKILERCIYVGTMENAVHIDGIYFGDYEYGNIATLRQLDKHFYVRDWKWVNNLHVGPLQLRPHARYYGKEIKSAKRRRCLEAYWANLGNDIAFIAKRYDR